MENQLHTPISKFSHSSKSESRPNRTPLSELNPFTQRLSLTPLTKQELSKPTYFGFNHLETQSQKKSSRIPLELLINPKKSCSKHMNQVLTSLRSKSSKSILKNSSQPSQKNVHFGDSVQNSERKSENKTQSLATTNNSVTESRLEVNEEEKNEFNYEEDLKASVLFQEFDEYPTVVFCRQCKRENVTVVSLEKVRPEAGVFALMVWGICWCLPACFYHETQLVHKCSFCFGEIARFNSA
jgi:hypothetical protein